MKKVIQKKTIQEKIFDGKRKQVSVTSEMEAEISAFMAKHRVESESALIREAIAAYLQKDFNDAALVLNALKDLGERQKKLNDMLNIIFSYLKRMHEHILVYNAPVDGTLKEAALDSAHERHASFFTFFQNVLKDDPPFFERLLHDYYSEGGNGKG